MKTRSTHLCARSLYTGWALSDFPDCTFCGKQWCLHRSVQMSSTDTTQLLWHWCRTRLRPAPARQHRALTCALFGGNKGDGQVCFARYLAATWLFSHAKLQPLFSCRATSLKVCAMAGRRRWRQPICSPGQHGEYDGVRTPRHKTGFELEGTSEKWLQTLLSAFKRLS